MSDQLVAFTWDVDQWGYEVVEDRPLPSGPRATLLAPAPTKWVRPKGGPTIRHDLDGHQGLFMSFARLAKTERDVLTFADKFGLLGSRSSKHVAGRERLDDWFESIAAIRRMDVFARAQRWDKLAEIFNGLSAVGRVAVRVARWDIDRPHLEFQARTLRDALFCQLVSSCARLERVRLCLKCGAPITYGHGTGRRSTARYCSDACRKAAFLDRQGVER